MNSMIWALIVHEPPGLLVIARHCRSANLDYVHIITRNVRLIMSCKELLHYLLKDQGDWKEEEDEEPEAEEEEEEEEFEPGAVSTVNKKIILSEIRTLHQTFQCSPPYHYANSPIMGHSGIEKRFDSRIVYIVTNSGQQREHY